MIFRIDSSSSVPVYAQLMEQVKRAVATGILRKGDLLPSRRELALELEINPLTVLKAYKELEYEGFIEIKKGIGCFVASGPEAAVEEFRRKILTRAIRGLINDAMDFGVPLEDLERMIREGLQSAEVEAVSKR